MQQSDLETPIFYGSKAMKARLLQLIPANRMPERDDFVALVQTVRSIMHDMVGVAATTFMQQSSPFLYTPHVEMGLSDLRVMMFVDQYDEQIGGCICTSDEQYVTLDSLEAESPPTIHPAMGGGVVALSGTFYVIVLRGHARNIYARGKRFPVRYGASQLYLAKPLREQSALVFNAFKVEPMLDPEQIAEIYLGPVYTLMRIQAESLDMESLRAAIVTSCELLQSKIEGGVSLPGNTHVIVDDAAVEFFYSPDEFADRLPAEPQPSTIMAGNWGFLEKDKKKYDA